jgi:hypothetical protein
MHLSSFSVDATRFTVHQHKNLQQLGYAAVPESTKGRRRRLGRDTPRHIRCHMTQFSGLVTHYYLQFGHCVHRSCGSIDDSLFDDIVKLYDNVNEVAGKLAQRTRFSPSAHAAMQPCAMRTAKTLTLCVNTDVRLYVPHEEPFHFLHKASIATKTVTHKNNITLLAIRDSTKKK